MSNTRESRRSVRVPTDLSVRWVRRDGPRELRALDINRGGLFLRTDLPMRPNYVVQLVVSVASLEIPMLVVTRFVGQTKRGYGWGVEIFVIDDVHRAQWHDAYVRLLSEMRQASAARRMVAAGVSG